MTNLDQQVGYDHQAKVWKDEGEYRGAIIAIIIEHNNSTQSPLYMKLGEKKNILTISMDERRTLAPGIFQRAQLDIFMRVLSKMLAEAYGITAFEIQNGGYLGRSDVADDHKGIFQRAYPTDEFLGWIKEQAEGVHIEIPTGTNLVNISDDVIQKYLEAAKEHAARMGAKEDPSINLSGIIVDA